MHATWFRKIADLGKMAFLGLMVMATLALPLEAQDGASALVGIWVGGLRVQAQSITLVVYVSEEKGALKVTIDSPDQGAKGIPVSSLSLEGSAVKLESKVINASFSGELSAEGTTISGTWAQGGASFPLVLEKKDAAPVFARPQEPKAPFPYKLEEVIVENARAGVKLAGTLVIPPGAGPFPAVVFATGSGAQNRDEELLGHKPFLLIADYLARRGIASLRCDDRGTGASTGDFALATTFDFADDVEAALEYLAARPEAKKGAIGILGHSEGALIAPILASRNPKVSFIALLAGPGIKGEDILYLQGKLIAKAQGASAADIERGMAINKVLYGIAKGSGEAAEIKAKAKEAYLRWVDEQASMKADEKAQARQGADQAVEALASPWFRTFLSLDPAPYLAKVKIPLLALYGSKDLQVPAKENLAAIKKALGAAANPKNKYVTLRGLNHLFQSAKSGSPDEYAKIEETFSPKALKTIGDWIVAVAE